MRFVVPSLFVFFGQHVDDDSSLLLKSRARILSTNRLWIRFISNISFICSLSSSCAHVQIKRRPSAFLQFSSVRPARKFYGRAPIIFVRATRENDHPSSLLAGDFVARSRVRKFLGIFSFTKFKLNLISFKISSFGARTPTSFAHP